MTPAFEVLSAAEADRVTALYAPLADAVRELADATIRTEADDDAVAHARSAIEAVTRLLRQRSRPAGVSYRVDGRTLREAGAGRPPLPPRRLGVELEKVVDSQKADTSDQVTRAEHLESPVQLTE